MVEADPPPDLEFLQAVTEKTTVATSTIDRTLFIIFSPPIDLDMNLCKRRQKPYRYNHKSPQHTNLSQSHLPILENTFKSRPYSKHGPF
ncbi:MAG: hypothetical protein LBI67_07575 [Treponema sp.]|nr:hypothetical protein [Treponema sp.]